MSKKAKDKTNVMECPKPEGQSEDDAMADLVLMPETKAAISLKRDSYNFSENLDVTALRKRLVESTEKLKDNDLSECDGILMSQAQTLDTLFHNMLNRGMSSEYLRHMKEYMNIALKAQNQSRMTLATLAEVKNPRPYIQHNQAQYQQVNNKPSSRGKKTKQTNELLEDKTHEQEWLDTGETQTTGRDDKDVETVGA